MIGALVLLLALIGAVRVVRVSYSLGKMGLARALLWLGSGMSRAGTWIVK